MAPVEATARPAVDRPGPGEEGRDWPPPYVLEGNAWCFLGLARTSRLQSLAGGQRLVSWAGFAPVLLQAIAYHSARSEANPTAVAYGEVAVSALAAGRPWAIVPLALLVDEPLAKVLGEPYGFPKVLLPELCVSGNAWTVTALAGEGRSLVAGRALGATLLLPFRFLLARARLQVRLPGGTRTRFTFRGVAELAPAIGVVSAPLRAWAGGAWLLPLGVMVGGFQFVLEAPGTG